MDPARSPGTDFLGLIFGLIQVNTAIGAARKANIEARATVSALDLIIFKWRVHTYWHDDTIYLKCNSYFLVGNPELTFGRLILRKP